MRAQTELEMTRTKQHLELIPLEEAAVKENWNQELKRIAERKAQLLERLEQLNSQQRLEDAVPVPVPESESESGSEPVPVEE
jgi:flagellar biosynthesis/type III secretory pathway chaperone